MTEDCSRKPENFLLPNDTSYQQQQQQQQQQQKQQQNKITQRF